jgi:transcription antitermination factor NusG
MEKVWRAIYVNSRAEKKVAMTLVEKGVEAYIPLVRTMRQWSDRKKMVEEPLLKGYLFVRIEPQQYDKVLSARGVVGYVRSAGVAARVRDEEIERLKQLIAFGYQLEAGPLQSSFREGDKIMITSGNLQGVEGYVLEADGEKTVYVVLESIGHCITVRVPKGIVATI